jgi:hypothetical protein
MQFLVVRYCRFYVHRFEQDFFRKLIANRVLRPTLVTCSWQPELGAGISRSGHVLCDNVGLPTPIFCDAPRSGNLIEPTCDGVKPGVKIKQRITIGFINQWIQLDCAFLHTQIEPKFGSRLQQQPVSQDSLLVKTCCHNHLLLGA